MKRVDPNWFLNDAFWAATFPFMFPDASFKAAIDQVERVVALTRCPAGTVLDLGCGSGRHAVPLAQRGFTVTGVDSSPFFIEKARAYAAASQVDVTLIQDDMRHFTRPASFDLVLSMFSSFGYFESDEDNRRVVQNACASLKPGGRLVMELMGKEVLARDFQQTGVRLHEPDVLFERRQVIEDWSRIRTDFYVVSGGTTREFSLQLWLYSGRELRQLLADAGFASIKLYGSFEATPYDTTAIRLIAVATKGK